MPLTGDEYVESRLAPEIDYYERRAGQSKMRFQAGSVLAIVASAAVPVLAATDFDRWVLAAAGGVASVAFSCLALFKWQENWLQFHGNAESLKKERALYETRTGPYRDLDGDDLVEAVALRAEELISREHQVWQLTQRESRS